VKVWVYINNSREVGDVDHLKVFANEEAAEKWFAELGAAMLGWIWFLVRCVWNWFKPGICNA
jgi:hypothetical protein